MRYWETLDKRKQGAFDIIIDNSWEDMAVRDLFDDSCCDLEEYERKVNAGELDWFMLRARVLLNGAEIGEHIIGGFLYEDASEVLTDGMADDVAYGAMYEAKKWLAGIKKVDLVLE